MTKQHSRAEIASILALREREGLTYAELARRTGVQRSTLAWWSWRARKDKRGGFAEIVCEDLVSSIDSGIELEAGGVRVRVSRDFDAATLAQVLAVVAKSC